MGSGLVNIHAVLPRSSVNGPGKRLVVFFQGCSRRCAGCFNPGAQPFETGETVGAGVLLDRYPSGGLEGITVSGGEPFMQPEGLEGLLAAARERSLSSVVYTGFGVEELEADPQASTCLGLMDVLIDGPFDETMPEPTLLARGSTNQRLHFLTSRYRLEDFFMPGRAEVFIGADGTVRETGFSRVTRTF